ncbi:hypothetical protein D9611_011271 [Ephemerocybe angulata]|uniref:Uncharacterized protein n=1 Tax=Ephemerocybe angulata TaxID=980116 RepID=A0A8H5BC06_9AGAR|nr:hypothetical protein D9611_011271 [Tulosesus angulatus]
MVWDRNVVGNTIARAMYSNTGLSLLFAGVQLFICAYSLAVYLETPNTVRSRGTIVYLVISFLLFAIWSIATCIDFELMFRMLFYATSPGDFYTRLQMESGVDPKQVLSNALSNIIVWISDALLLYRCHIVFSDKRLMIVAPVVTYLLSIAFGIIDLSPMGKTNWINKAGEIPYMSLFIIFSVATNLLVTVLISWRLIQARRQFSALGRDKKGLAGYTTVVAILVESAIPLAVFGIVYAVLLATIRIDALDLLKKDATRLIMTVFYFGFAALSPQLIILRVMTGRSFVRNFNDHEHSPSAATNDIAFASNRTGITSTSDSTEEHTSGEYHDKPENKV